MKEDNNNIKMLIAAILKLSSKLSKCNTSANAPKTSVKAAPKTSAKAAPKTSVKAVPKTSVKAAPKTSAKAAPKASAKAAPKTVMRKIVGGGSAEFFE